MGGRGSREVHHYHTTERVVEKIIEKIINVDKDRYDQDQEFLASILNQGLPKIERSKKGVMTIGPSGTGKSTVLNIFYKANFKTGVSATDVTVEMTLGESQALGMVVCDTVGFLPTIANVGKMFVLFFHRGFFPDSLVYPASTDRIVDILTLQRLAEAGFIKVTIFPFNAKVYYAIEQYSEPNAVKDALGEPKAIEEMRLFIDMAKISGHVSVFDGNDSSPPAPFGSMKDEFCQAFFKDGKYLPKSYEEHIRGVKAGNQTEILRGVMVNAIADLHNHAKIEGGEVISIHECNYLKG